LEAVRAEIEGPYGSQLVKVDVVKVGMVKALKEKDAEIECLQQQLQVCNTVLHYTDLVKFSAEPHLWVLIRIILKTHRSF